MKKALFTKIFLLCMAALSLGGCRDKDNNNNKPIEGNTPTDISETIKYSFRFNGTNCSADNLDEYKANELVNITITPNTDFEFCNDIIVTGVNDYQFNVETGILSLIMTNDVSVICVCENPELCTIKYNLEHIKVSSEGNIFKNTLITLRLTADDGYKLPELGDIHVTNGDIRSFDSSTGVLSLFIVDNATLTASAIRIACTIELDLTHATVQGIKDTYYMNDTCSGKVIADRKYVLPQTIVLEGDSLLNSYNSATGEFEILIKTRCKIRIAAIYSPVLVTCDYIATNCSISKSKNYDVYDEFNETITAYNNYVLPQNIQVVGLEEGYVYDDVTGSITGTVIGNIQISVSCNPNQNKIATYTFNGEYCSSSDVDMLFIGDEFDVVLTPLDGYKLPSIGDISISGLEEGFTFNSSTGEIKGIVRNSEIVISCNAIEIIFAVSFQFSGTNCSTNYRNQYDINSEISLKITPDFGFELTDQYTSTGLNNISYDPITGIFQATVVDDATLEISASKITTQYSYSIIAGNCKQNFSGTATYGTIVEVKVEPNLAYKLPAKLDSSSGCKDINYDSNTGKISFVVVGDVEIKLSAVYDPKGFSFTLNGDNVNCDAPLSLVEGANFSCKLSADEFYILPDNVTITGLANANYDQYNHEVTGIVIDNVTITCNGIFDSEHYVPLKLNCSHCTAANAPEYVLKNSDIQLDIICDSGYTFNNDCVEVVYGKYTTYYVESSTLYLGFDGASEYFEYNIIASVSVGPIKTNCSHCSLDIYGEDYFDKILFAFINVDEGYILPDTISYEGMELITYNKELQTMTFRRLSPLITISITAVEGELNYNPFVTKEKFENLVYYDWVYNPSLGCDVWDFSQHDFQNVSAIEVLNENFSQSETTKNNDVIIYKTDSNHCSTVTKESIDYIYNDDPATHPYDGMHYIHQEGLGWKHNTLGGIYNCLDLAMGFWDCYDFDTAEYNENGRYYYNEANWTPTYLFFKDGRLAAGLFLDPVCLQYVEFYDYDNTTVEEYETPSEYFSLSINYDWYNVYVFGVPDSYSYEYGYILSIKLDAQNDYFYKSHFEIDGLDDWSFDIETGLLTGIVTDNVTINIIPEQ